MKVCSVWLLSCGAMLTSPPPASSARQAVLLEPRPQGHVLRVAEAGRGQLLALEVGRPVDVRLDDEEGAARGGAGDDPHGLALGLGVRVDGRVRADVGHVDGVGEQRLGGLRARVEGRGLERHVRRQVLLEDPLAHADQGRSRA